MAVLLFVCAVRSGSAETLTLVGQMGGACDAVAVSGQYACIGEGANFSMLNIINPQNPIRASSTRLPAVITDIKINVD